MIGAEMDALLASLDGIGTRDYKVWRNKIFKKSSPSAAMTLHSNIPRAVESISGHKG